MAKFKPVHIKETKYGTYSLEFTNPNGRRRRLSVGKDLQYAQRLSVRFNDWLVEGKDPERELERIEQAERAKNITIREFFTVFMERHGSLQSQNMIDFYHQRYKNFARCLQLVDISMGEITRKLMSDYMHTRKKQDGISNSTVNRELTVVKTLLNKAVEWEYIEKNPIEKLSMLPEPPKRNVFLTTEQASALLNELTEPFANIVEFAIYTGFRLQNILGLKIEDVMFHDIDSTGSVRFKIKGGKWGSYPVGVNAVDVLNRAIDKRKSVYVFINPRVGKRYYSVSQSFRRAVKKLDLNVGDSYLRFHDLKHVFSTWLHERGASLDDLRILCQHSKRSTTDRYITANTNGASNVLALMPKIESMRHGKAS